MDQPLHTSHEPPSEAKVTEYVKPVLTKLNVGETMGGSTPASVEGTFYVTFPVSTTYYGYPSTLS